MEKLDNEMDSIFLDVLEGDQSVASNALLEDSFSSNIGIGEAPSSTPHSKSRARSRRPAPSDRLKCPQCSNTYANERTRVNHVRLHAMKSASSRFPTEEEMKELTKISLLASLKEIQEESLRSSTTDNMYAFCEIVEQSVVSGENEPLIRLLTMSFLVIMKRQNDLLPSSLRSTVYQQTNALLSSKDFRQKLVHSLRKLREVPTNIQELPEYSSDASHPEEFKQLVYYIGGFILNGLLRKSEMYSSNANWVAFGNIVQMKLLKRSLDPDNCPAHITCFTTGKDKGGLKFLYLEAFDFFMPLFRLLMTLEEADGSLPFEKVLQQVFKDCILVFMLDDLVGCELTEEQFLEFFRHIICCCCKVVSKGILRRRLNSELVKAYASVALRPRLAR